MDRARPRRARGPRGRGDGRGRAAARQPRGRRGGGRAALRGHARLADPARQPARAARRPRPAAGRRSAPATFALLDLHGHARLQRRARAHRPATSCWRGSARRLETRAGRRRARLPARRRAAVRAADGDRRRGRAGRRPRPAARWTSADRLRRRLPRGDGRAARARRGASPPCCASRTRGWHATGMLRPLALDLEERRADGAAGRRRGEDRPPARRRQADRARADRAADRRRDVHRARRPRAPALLPARDGRARGAGRRRDHRLRARSTGATSPSPPTTSR